MLERLRNLLQSSYNNVHHTLSMLLHYLRKSEVRIWWKLHCALKNAFYFISFKSMKS